MLSGMEQDWKGVFAQGFLCAGGEAFPFSQGLQFLGLLSLSGLTWEQCGKMYCPPWSGGCPGPTGLDHLTSIAPWPESL